MLLLASSSASQRFRPITVERPKVLLPLMNVPMIEYTLEWLSLNKVEEVGGWVGGWPSARACLPASPVRPCKLGWPASVATPWLVEQGTRLGAAGPDGGVRGGDVPLLRAPKASQVAAAQGHGVHEQLAHQRSAPVHLVGIRVGRGEHGTGRCTAASRDVIRGVATSDLGLAQKKTFCAVL